MRHVRGSVCGGVAALVSVCVICGGPTVFGAGTYRAGDVTATTADATFEVPVFFDHDDTVTAATVILDHDVSAFSVEDVTIALNAVVPEWHNATFQPAWTAMGWILDWAPPYENQVLPAGTHQEICRFVCRLQQGLTPRTAVLHLPVEGRGGVPLVNGYVVNHEDVYPQLVDSTLTIRWAAPTIVSIAPANTSGGVAIVVTGTHFLSGVTTFALAGGTLQNVTIVSETEAHMTVPACTEGGVRTITACNTGLCGEGTYVCRSAPVVTGLDPASSTGGTVQIRGSELYPETTVRLDGAPVAAVYRSPTLVTFQLPSCGTHILHTVEVCNGLLCTTAECECWPGPAITAITPDSTSGGAVLAISGTGFVPGETVFLIDGAAAPDFSVESDVAAHITVPPCAEGGDHVVTVCNGSFCGNAMYTCRGAPAITGVTPAVSSGGAAVVEGSAFFAETVFTLDGESIAAEVADGSHATIQIPACDVHVVHTLGACNGSLCAEFQYECWPQVTIDSIATRFAGTTATLTVTGAGFLPESTVTIQDVPVAFTVTPEGALVIEGFACDVAGSLTLRVCNASFCAEGTFLCGTPFKRGDANADAAIDIADAIRILGYLFSGSVVTCRDTADANDDGNIDIADAIFLLGHLFAQGRNPPPPFQTVGLDPTPDNLDCAKYR